MKLASTVVASLLLADKAVAFNPHSVLQTSSKTRHGRNSQKRFMAMDMEAPPAAPADTTSNLPVITQNAYGQPTEVRYSDFLKLVNKDRIEKVTFSADGTQLLGVDVDGTRIRIEALPNDPDLLTSLTNHKVDVTVLPQQEASGLGELAQSLIFPAALFAGLFFLSRRGGVGGMGGGPGNHMGFGKSKAQ